MNNIVLTFDRAIGLVALSVLAPAAEVRPVAKEIEYVQPVPVLICPLFRPERPMIIRNQRQRRRLNRQVPQRLRNK